MLRLFALCILMMVPPGAAHAQENTSTDRAGDVYEIRQTYETESASDDGQSSSRSRGGGMLVERVIAVTEAGTELEFDVSVDTSVEDRARDWQFPVRVFKPSAGPMRVLNLDELESRISAWLTLGDMTREACGRWIFTWNAFKIECDPQSVLQTLESYDLRSAVLQDGGLYDLPGTIGPASVTMKPSASGPVFEVEAPIDPDVVRRQQAESDLVVAEIYGNPVPTLEEALMARSDDPVSGTVTATFETDAEGRITKRTKVTRMERLDFRGETERSVETQTVERRLISRQ